MGSSSLAACRIRQLGKVSRFAASSLLTLVQMVDADLGITYLPALAEGSPLLAQTRVRTYPLPDDAYRDIGLVWRRGSARGEEFRALGRYLAEHRPQPPAGPAARKRAARRGKAASNS